MKLSWLLPVGVVAYLYYQSQVVNNTVQMLNYYIAGVKYNKSNSNLFRTELLVTLRINNPAYTGVSFDSFSGALFIKGKQIASANASGFGSGIIIKQNATTDVTFPVIINHLSLALEIKDLITQWVSGGINQLITVTGNLVAGGVTIPISQDVTVKADKTGATINGTNRYEQAAACSLQPSPFLNY